MPPQYRPARPLADVVDASLNEATFLWQQWERDLASPTRNLEDVWFWTEDRLHGALDGITLPRGRVIDVATPALLSGDPSAATIGAAALAVRGSPHALTVLTKGLLAADPANMRAMIRGVELVGRTQVVAAVARALTGAGPDHAALACRLKAFRRMAPAEEVMVAWRATDAASQAAAVALARHTSSREADAFLATAVRSEEPVVRLAAVEAGIARGDQRAWLTALDMGRRLDAESGPYLKFIALLGAPEDHEIVYAALRVPALQKDAVWALGHVGTHRAAASCIAGMQYEHLQRACGEAYSWITGANLVADRLQVVEAPDDPPEFADDDLDADLVPTPEALWPAPDIEAVQRHWHSVRERFSEGVRYARGAPLGMESLLALVERGPMLRRSDIILALSARTRGAYDVEPRAFTGRQREMMTAGRTAAATAPRA